MPSGVSGLVEGKSLWSRMPSFGAKIDHVMTDLKGRTSGGKLGVGKLVAHMQDEFFRDSIALI